MTEVHGPDFLSVQVRDLERSLSSLRADDAQALHDHLKGRIVPILVAPFDTPFGRTFVFQDPDSDEVAIHGSD